MRNHPHLCIWYCYWIGWLVFVLAQAHNSVLSQTNGLRGWPGYKRWFQVQWANLMVRAFASAVFATAIIQQVAEKVQMSGFPVHAYAIDALSGFAANALLYQILGALPWLGLRAEVSQLAPPPSSKDSNSGDNTP